MNFSEKTYKEVRRVYDLHQSGKEMSFEDQQKLLTIQAWLRIEKAQKKYKKDLLEI